MIPNVRPLTEEEKPSARALYRNAFKIDTEMSERWLRLTDVSNTRAIVDDGRVLSILIILPMKVWIGGRSVAMGGISGVATWADQQGKGYAGHLVRNALADMRDRGEAFSILYPFSFPFYGRFGYELVNHYTTYTATQQQFVSPPVSERTLIRAVRLPEGLPEIQECYSRMAPRWNTMLDRDNTPWNAPEEMNSNRWAQWKEYWSADKRQIYAIDSIDQKGIAGYFGVIDHPLPEGGFEALVTELMIDSDDSRNALARFCRRLPANVKKIKLVAPPQPSLWNLFQEPTVTTQLNACYQARVVEMEKACRERGYKSDLDETVTLRIKDDCAPWNSGTWTLQVNGGSATATKSKPNDPNNDSGPLLTIRQFSAIFTGYKAASEVAPQQGQHEQTLAALDRIFHDRETRLLDHF